MSYGRRFLTANFKWPGDVLSAYWVGFVCLNSLPASNLPFALSFLGFSVALSPLLGVSLSSSLSSFFFSFLRVPLLFFSFRPFLLRFLLFL